MVNARTPQPNIRVLVVYAAGQGVLQLLTQSIAEGARPVAGVQVELLAVEDQPLDTAAADTDQARTRRAAIIDRFATANALIVGASVYFGSVVSPVMRLFEDWANAGDAEHAEANGLWYGHAFRDRVGAAFAVSTTPHGRHEQGLHAILTMMMHLGMIIVTPGQHSPTVVEGSAPS